MAETFNVSFKMAIPVVLVASFFASIDFIIIGNCLVLTILFYKKNKAIFLYISAVLAFLGLFIKTSIGVSSLSVIFVSLLIDFYHNKNIIKSLKQIGVITILGMTFGLIVFQGFIPLFQFFWGAFKLSSGYGETLSLFPPNNKILILLFIVLILSFPVWNKEKDVRIAFLLSVFPLFASWKHSFIRQDIYHYAVIVTFLFIFWSIMMLISSKKQIATFIVACCTILLLYANMKPLPMYRGINKEIVGINNFTDVLNYRDFKQRMLSISEQNIAPNRLTEEQRALIGDKTMDVYPWEFSYISANGISWKPRRTLELGASTSQWASMEASKNYLLKKDSPEFILFHYQKDRYDNNLGSIDDRYILNDEPLVIYNILNNYLLEEKTDKFLLFKKDITSHFEKPILENVQNLHFNEWIDLPLSQNKSEIIRLKVISKNTFWGTIKKMLYKEAEYYIDYMLANGDVYTYRYIPKTAVDGLWCSPFIQNPKSDIIENDVVKIRLHNNSSRCISPEIIIQFEKLRLKTDYIDTTASSINSFLFKKTEIQTDIIENN